MITCFSRILLFLIGLYQKFISPLLGNRCRFYPTCSEYAMESIKTLPLHRALVYIIWRIFRCGPWAKGGVDFVVMPPSLDSGKKGKEQI